MTTSPRDPILLQASQSLLLVLNLQVQKPAKASNDDQTKSEVE